MGIIYITKEDFFPAFSTAFQEAIIEKNIQGGFRGSGLIPYDPDVVLSKLDIKLKTLMPPGSSNRLSKP